MGYQTIFNGSFETDKPLARKHFRYLEDFSLSRRMKRDSKIAEDLDDPRRLAAGLPIGEEGGYFVGCSKETIGGDSVLDASHPPKGQPGLWCQWIPTEDDEGNTYIAWDGSEKFYHYIEWVEYLIEHFLKPWGYLLNGEVEWKGERGGDLGKIVVTNNVVKVLRGKITYEEIND